MYGNRERAFKSPNSVEHEAATAAGSMPNSIALLSESSSSSSKENDFEQDVSHAQVLLGYLNRLYEEGRYTDVTVRCDGVSVRQAHRIVLAAFSGSLKQALGSSETGHNTNLDIDSRITGISASDLEVIIDYMYFGRLALCRPSVMSCLRSLKCDATVAMLQSFEHRAEPELVIEDCDHANRLLFTVEALRSESKFIDCVLRNRGVDVIWCHRLVLSAFSPFFEKLFADLNAESVAVVELSSAFRYLPIHYVNAIVDFMYSGRVNAERKHFPALRTAAALMQTPQLMRILTEEIDLTRAHLRYYEAVTGTDLDNKGEHLDDCSSTGNDDGNLLESEASAADYGLIYNTFVQGPERGRKLFSNSRQRPAMTVRTVRSSVDDADSTTGEQQPPYAIVVLNEAQWDRSRGANDGRLPEIVTPTHVKVPLMVGDQEKMMQKPYKCPHCSHRTREKSGIAKHIRCIHTKEAPYQCTHCSQAFKVKSNLIRHVRAHTGEKPYLCKKCGMAYADKKNMDAHVFREHLKQQPYHCSEENCRAKFWRHDRYVHHCQKVHGSSASTA